MQTKYLKNYIEDLLSKGKWYFTKKKALSDLKINSTVFNQQFYRLRKKKL